MRYEKDRQREHEDRKQIIREVNSSRSKGRINREAGKYRNAQARASNKD
jgi:hypothetical protein